MVNLTIILLSTDGSKRESIRCNFPSDEWNAVVNFHADVELLRSTKYVQRERGGTIALSLKAGQSPISKAPTLDSDDVWSMLLKLRPFLLQDEDHYFYSFKKLLERRLHHHPAFLKHLNEIKAHFELQHMQKRVNLHGPGRPPLSKAVVMDWLNATEYHKNSEKRRIVKEDLGIFGDDQNGRPIVLFALTDMIQAILSLGDFAETLLEAADGNNVITCPPEFFIKS